jgi:methionyl-tRNA formyltransferase
MLKKFGEKVVKFYKKLSLNDIKKIKPELIISDRYKFIIDDKICRHFKSNIINLHPSFLPYCRGSNPIFFSVYKKRPIGISIHVVTKNLDAGPILLQKKIIFNNQMTLRDLYKTIREEFKILLRKNWYFIKKKKIKTRPQSSHIKEIYKGKEFHQLFSKLKLNYDMKIKEIYDRL